MNYKDKRNYVYTFRLLDGTPIYVGKGLANRFRDHYRKDRETRLARKIRKIEKEEGYLLYPDFTFAKSDAAGQALEKELIAKYGREDLGKGPLYNLTDGGDGIAGCKRGPVSEETRRKIGLANSGVNNPRYGIPLSEEVKEKMSASKRGKPRSEETKEKLRIASTGARNPNFGKPRLLETSEKIRASQLGEKNHRFGKTNSEETRRKISEAHKGRLWPTYCCPHCSTTGVGPSMFRYHFDNCKHKKGPDEPGQT